MASEDDDGYEPVACYTEWWDCPRSGVAIHAGRLHRFLCEFSDELDDYPDEFRLWPIDDATFDTELAAWRAFAAWRARFDRGERTGPLESDPAFTELSAALRSGRLTAPSTANIVVPIWRLDADRSFRDREPRHSVRWRER